MGARLRPGHLQSEISGLAQPIRGLDHEFEKGWDLRFVHGLRPRKAIAKLRIEAMVPCTCISAPDLPSKSPRLFQGYTLPKPIAR